MPDAPPDLDPSLPFGPPAIALVAARQLVTRHRLRLTDPADSRLGALRAHEYHLGAASWTGRRAEFVGFFTPPPVGAAADLEARVRAAARWAEDRLAAQGAEQAGVLLVALGPIPGAGGPRLDAGQTRVGALSVDRAGGQVDVLAPPPPGLPGVSEVRQWAREAEDPERVPTLAAVDLAERQVVAGGYSAPAKRALTVTQPYVSYALIGIFAGIWLLEQATRRAALGGSDYPILDVGALVAGPHASTDWWTVVTAGFVHSGGDITHVLFNGLAVYWIGASIERLYGPVVLVGTFLGSVIGASLFFIAASDAGLPTGGAVVGASGGIAGLVGLLLVLGRVQGRDVPVGVVASVRQYALVIIAINVVFGLVSKDVSNTGHLGGLLAGMLIGLVLPPLRAVGGRDLSTAERLAVGAVVVFCAVALGVGAAHLPEALSPSPA